VGLTRHTMTSDERLLSLIECLYAAPGSEAGWQAFLARLNDALGSSGTSIISHDLAAGGTGVAASTVDDEGARRAYEQRWGRLDPWAPNPIAGALTTGAVVPGERLVARHQYGRSAFYNEFGRFIDVDHCAVIVAEREPHVLSGLSSTESRCRGALDRRDLELLDALAPHVQRALQLHRRIVSAEASALALTDAVDRLPHGVIWLDSQAWVCGTNRVADALLAERDGLVLDGRELRATNARSTNTLRALVRQWARTARGEALDAGGRLLIERSSGRLPLHLVAAPRFGPAAGRALQASVMVLVTDPGRMPLPTADDLRMLFGLTPAEAALAVALAQGRTLAHASERLGVRVETARTRLKDIFAKTNTHRQAELVRLLIHSAPLR